MTFEPSEMTDREVLTFLVFWPVFVSLMVLVQYCFVDILYVAGFIPQQRYLLLLSFLILPSLALFAWSKWSRHSSTLEMLFAAIGIGALLSHPLIYTVGLCFHLSIGGTL